MNYNSLAAGTTEPIAVDAVTGGVAAGAKPGLQKKGRKRNEDLFKRAGEFLRQTRQSTLI